MHRTLILKRAAPECLSPSLAQLEGRSAGNKVEVLLHVNTNSKARYLLSPTRDGTVVAAELVAEEAGAG